MDDHNLQIKTGVLVCANMQDLMLTKLLTSLKRELKEELVLLFMPDSSLTIFLFLRESFFWNIRAQKSALKN